MSRQMGNTSINQARLLLSRCPMTSRLKRRLGLNTDEIRQTRARKLLQE